MAKWLTKFGPMAALLLGMAAVAQAPAEPPAPQRTIEERVAAIEALVTRIDTRLAMREALATPDQQPALTRRVEELERAVARIGLDVQQTGRQVDEALRQIADVRRSATEAERLARDAATRR